MKTDTNENNGMNALICVAIIVAGIICCVALIATALQPVNVTELTEKVTEMEQKQQLLLNNAVNVNAFNKLHASHQKLGNTVIKLHTKKEVSDGSGKEKDTKEKS